MEAQARPPQAPHSFIARFLAAIRSHSTHLSAPRPTHKAGRPKSLWQYPNRICRSYGTGSTGRTFRDKKALFSYGRSASVSYKKHVLIYAPL